MIKFGIGFYIFAVGIVSCKQDVSDTSSSTGQTRVVLPEVVVPTNSLGKGNEVLKPEGPLASQSSKTRDAAYIEFRQVVDKYKKQFEREIKKVNLNDELEERMNFLLNVLAEYETPDEQNYVYTALEHDVDLIEKLSVILDALYNASVSVSQDDQSNLGVLAKLANYVYANFIFIEKGSIAFDLCLVLFELTHYAYQVLYNCFDEANLTDIQSADEFIAMSAQLDTIMMARADAISKVKDQIVVAAASVSDIDKLIEEIEKITKDGEAASAFMHMKESTGGFWELKYKRGLDAFDVISKRPLYL
ncbi:hypothetical protein bcCo53_001139 (plasmid) [Borrelia coriaceae]|nr:hypothetical protein [Borrelia coriaceae]UPA16971.1 hypothetical protein bcCo53_001139 [Borrelia coriaceae]